MSLSPIALFVFNRPEHTRLTIDALAKNIGAPESDLYVFCDGARTIEDEPAVEEVRGIVNNIQGFRSVTVKASDHNKGLAASIISGVTDLCKRKGRVIVVEDDLVSSEYFLDYMNSALDKYQENDRVMHISGYMFPVAQSLREAVFLPITSSWGWATWDRAWLKFESDGKKLYGKLAQNKLFSEFNVRQSFNYKRMLKRQIEHKVNSWAIRWYASVFLDNGIGLFPPVSLVKNIGFDDSGVHCSGEEEYNVQDLADSQIALPEVVEISEFALRELVSYYKENRIARLKRGIRKLLMVPLRNA